MNIALIGYGKMGKAIEKLAKEKGHSISAIISGSQTDWSPSDLAGTDVAIEFTQPDAAVNNIEKCIEANVPVVVGTTGWYDQFDSIVKQVESQGSALFTATNFSVGVNIMFYINKKLAEIMNQFPEYAVEMEEIHHIHKKDYPSGTASTLAEGIVESLDRKNNYIGQLEGQEQDINAFDLRILCKREDEVPGFHEVTYESEIDNIKISHAAKSRAGFALGSILAAEWLQGKKGVFGMKDLLKFD
ncbi:4-hydroxy-tetrahydrodipicolinate reductase [bacterium]|nr:4-hydroxy-tetrahydrodipicolinate reductase [bacterium]